MSSPNYYINGGFAFDKPLTAEHMAEVNVFIKEEHRDPTGATLGQDPAMPGIHCCWEIDEEGTEIHATEAYDYGFCNWIPILIEKYFEPWGYILNGEADWDGQESGDDGTATVVNNVMTTQTVSEVLEEQETYARELLEGVNKLLSLVPEQLPLLIGINGTMDTIVKEHLKSSEIKVAITIAQLIELGATGTITKE